jgi:DNA-binding response OmpR family regulator
MLPVVVLSGAAERANQLECFRLGADEFFEKPFDPEILGAALGRQLARARGVAARTERSAGAGPGPTAAVPDATVRGARVLVVEDDPTTAALLSHRLGREGMTLDHRTGGTEALGLVRSESAGGDYDLVLLDLNLPGVGGLELLREMRTRSDWSRVPVVVLSAMGRDADIVQAFELGASDYVVKPFSPPELVARIHRLLRG